MSAVSASTAAVIVEDLVRTYPGGLRAVDGINLQVAEGEIYGFLGPNGAGKSTAVRMLTTLLRPTSGRALVAGFDVVKDAASVRRNIGVALQEAALDPLLTGRELLELRARSTDSSRTARERAATRPARPRRVGGCRRTPAGDVLRRHAPASGSRDGTRP